MAHEVEEALLGQPPAWDAGLRERKDVIEARREEWLLEEAPLSWLEGAQHRVDPARHVRGHVVEVSAIGHALDAER